MLCSLNAINLIDCDHGDDLNEHVDACWRTSASETLQKILTWIFVSKSVNRHLLIVVVQIILGLEIVRVILSNISHTLTLWRCSTSHVVHIALRLGMSRST